MKIVIDTTSPAHVSYNAGPKARIDVERTLNRLGYEILNIKRRSFKIGFVSILFAACECIIAFRKIKKDDIVILQYPLYFYNYFLEKIVLRYLCKRSDNVTFLIHDLGFLRYQKLNKNEISILNMPNSLIVHTPRMKDIVAKFLYKSKISIKTLFLFDYYTEATLLSDKDLVDYKNVIAFAGNLGKSFFLKELDSNQGELIWHLYGKEANFKIHFSESIKYNGLFQPNNPSSLIAGWGLVWDGDSLEGCTGIAGDYLKYNSPHKTSLYLSRGIPLIVWSGSALSDFVTKNNIGISISSIHQIENVINSIAIERYKEIINNVRLIREKIVGGYYLTETISNEQ